jgi:hypothetical protein
LTLISSFSQVQVLNSRIEKRALKQLPQAEDENHDSEAEDEGDEEPQEASTNKKRGRSEENYGGDDDEGNTEDAGGKKRRSITAEEKKEKQKVRAAKRKLKEEKRAETKRQRREENETIPAVLEQLPETQPAKQQNKKVPNFPKEKTEKKKGKPRQLAKGPQPPPNAAKQISNSGKKKEVSGVMWGGHKRHREQKKGKN